MNTLLLQRIARTTDGVLGDLILNGTWVCYCVERPWRDNKPRRSCIPTGSYPLLMVSDSPIMTRLGYDGNGWEVCDVPGRTHILLHPGNRPTDSMGCILPTSTIDISNGAKGMRVSGGSSRVAYEKLNDALMQCNGHITLKVSELC